LNAGRFLLVADESLLDAMNVFFDFPLLSSFITLVAIVLIARTVLRIGGGSRRAGRDCANCGANMPWNAEYCRRCGSKLS